MFVHVSMCCSRLVQCHCGVAQLELVLNVNQLELVMMQTVTLAACEQCNVQHTYVDFSGAAASLSVLLQLGHVLSIQTFQLVADCQYSGVLCSHRQYDWQCVQHLYWSITPFQHILEHRHNVCCITWCMRTSDVRWLRLVNQHRLWSCLLSCMCLVA